MTNIYHEKKIHFAHFFFFFKFKHLQKHTKSKVKIDDGNYHPELSNKAKLHANKEILKNIRQSLF